MKITLIIVFKGKTRAFWEKNCKNFVKDKNLTLKLQAWVDKNLFQKWLNDVWFVNYTYKTAFKTVLNLDQATTHYTEDLKEIF